MPPLITHPSHPNSHPLSLLPNAAYPGGRFTCDACLLDGTGFSYHCSHCSFDLHILCASKPLSVTHHLHPHPINLTFSPPYGINSGFSCDVCRQVGSSNWLYRCAACEFDVHLDCASAGAARPRPPPLQHQQSMPAMEVGGPQQYYYSQQGPAALQHSASMGASQSQQPQGPWQPAQSGPQYYPAAAAAPTVAQSGPQYYPATGHTAVQSGPQYSPATAAGPTAAGSVGNMGMEAAVQGFVEDAAQQIGQSFVQNLMGTDNDDNGGGGDEKNTIDDGDRSSDF